MSAQATFFYGVFVKSAYLCFASDAYKKVKNALLSIDLICARRRKGSLSTGGSSDIVGRVPEEVWKMIKLEIADEGMEEAEQTAVGQFIGAEECDCGICAPPYSWEHFSHNIDLQDSYYGNGGTSDMLSDRQKEIESMVANFGLALPIDSVYSTEEFPHFDNFALSAISLPLHKTGSGTASTAPFPRVDTEYSENGPIHHLLQFSKQALKLPRDADQRIKRFLSFFRLEPINPETETVSRPRKPKQTESKPRKANHKSRCCSDPETEPHWHLWGVSQYY